MVWRIEIDRAAIKGELGYKKGSEECMNARPDPCVFHGVMMLKKEVR